MAEANRNDQSGSQAALMELGVLVVSAVVYAISFLLTMALSRYRELAADRSGAILIGRPSLLASALVKVTGEMSPHPHPRPAVGRALQRLLLHPGHRQGHQPVVTCSPPTPRSRSASTSWPSSKPR